MNIYLDFEATQFKENIIAIGASCIYGDFSCLVKPPKGDKITKFITELTGITKEMASNALSYDEGFLDFYAWICLMNEISETPVFYHSYGNMDKKFLKNSSQYVTIPFVKEFLEILSEALIDDSTQVKKYFHTESIGVFKALHYFFPTYAEQDHDPLNDAIALKFLMIPLKIAKPLEKNPFKKKNESNTTSNVSKIIAKQINVKNPITKTFSSFEEALEWMYKKIKKPCPNAIKKNVENHLKKAILNNRNYHNYNWKKEES